MPALVSFSLNDYRRLLDLAFAGGIRNSPIRTSTPNAPFLDARHQREFMAACHRGYDKAQKQIIAFLCKLAADERCDRQERYFSELLLRKIADGMAVVMLQHKTHFIRRLVLHDAVPRISLETLLSTAKAVDSLNKESRMTFALVADLTTFIHVADVLRIDFRQNRPTVSLMELKSGKVNTLLLDQLEKHQASETSLQMLKEGSAIATSHKPQAERMMRQKVRLRQIQKIMDTDRGTDPRFKIELRLSKYELTGIDYGNVLDQLCIEAKEQSYSGGNVDFCIHIGIGYSTNENLAKQNAELALNAVIRHYREAPPNGFTPVYEEVKKQIRTAKMLMATDLFKTNVQSFGCLPFVFWRIKREHLLSLISGELCVLVAFDVASFIMLAREIGLDIRLSTRREAHSVLQELGGKGELRWGGRILKMYTSEESHFVMSGFYSRFIADLIRPRPFLSQVFTHGGFPKNRE